LIKDGKLAPDFDDEVISASCVTRAAGGAESRAAGGAES
jgi:NAD(P) transhydrogenase subunit alpha